MTVYLGSARIDENNRAKGGKAGDQTGKEVSTQKWYKHTKGWIVLRAKNSEKREKIALDMEKACRNPHIGYDQNQRLTLYNIAKQYDFDCGKVDKNCETDCSALVRVCCAYAGIEVGNFTTSNEVSKLMATKQFVELTDPKYTDSPNYLMRGDILVTRTQGHTVVVLTNGAKVKTNENNNCDNDFCELNENSVLITGGRVFVRKSPDIMSLAIGVAVKGETYPYYDCITDSTRTWYKIKYNDNDGYVSGKYAVPILS